MSAPRRWDKDVELQRWREIAAGEKDRRQLAEAEVERLRAVIGAMECDCLPYAKPGDGMCQRCMAIEGFPNREDTPDA